MPQDGTPSLPPRLRLLASPARDARGRDVWPLLHRSLRAMKWSRATQIDYQRLVFGSRRHMALIVICWMFLMLVPIAGVAGAMFSAIESTIQRGVAPAFPLQWLVYMQVGLVALTLPATLVLKWWYIRRNASRRVIPSLVAQKRCAACLYQLNDAPVAEDGCTVCPECGSAWHLPLNAREGA